MKLDLPEGLDRLPELAGIALFRILQESLTNVHRHSGSSAVEISLKASKQDLVFTVKDFGHGMPAQLIQGSQTNGDHFGVGLSGMRERGQTSTGRGGVYLRQNGSSLVPRASVGSGQRVKSPVVVEKLHFPRNRRSLGDRKCLRKKRTSFVGLPIAKFFRAFSRE